MARIEIPMYRFCPPEPIGEQEYLQLKAELKRDPSFSLENPNESITKRFGALFRFWIYNIPITLGALYILFSIADALDKDSFLSNLFGLLGVPVMFWGFITIFFVPMCLFFTVASYATYLRQKRRYFRTLLALVEMSSSYQDFRVSMYGY